MYKALLIISLVILFKYSYCQKPELTFKNTIYNFGSIGKQWLPPATFIYTNTGDSKLAVLFGTLPNGVTIDYSRKYIQAGESDTIKVYYGANKVGFFEEKIEVNSNASNIPVYLTISGIVTEVIECPSIQNSKNKNIKQNQILLIVVDEFTNNSIKNANINIVGRIDEFNGKTNNFGKFENSILPSNYKITVSAENYKTITDYKYISKNNKPIIYRLQKETQIATEKIPSTSPLLSTNISNIKPENKKNILSNEILSREKYSPNNIVFLVDISSSMKGKTKIEYLKRAVITLIDATRDIDNISLITYNKETNVIFEAVSGDKKDVLIEFIKNIFAEGGTRGIIGLTKAYQIGLNNFINNGNNEVYIATDGEFKSPEFSEKELNLLIKGNTQLGIKLSVIGFGNDNIAIKSMKKMAKVGEGNYIHIDKESQIENILIDEIKTKSLIK